MARRIATADDLDGLPLDSAIIARSGEGFPPRVWICIQAGWWNKAGGVVHSEDLAGDVRLVHLGGTPWPVARYTYIRGQKMRPAGWRPTIPTPVPWPKKEVTK